MLTIDSITEIPLPRAVVDLAPVVVDGRPEWLVLDDTGLIGGWDLSPRGYRQRAATTVPAAENRQRHRLHAARDGTFAAVVIDRGRWGEVVDLRTGRDPTWNTRPRATSTTSMARCTGARTATGSSTTAGCGNRSACPRCGV